jgi:hypothetical protein
VKPARILTVRGLAPLSAQDDHDLIDVKACIQELQTDLPDMLQANFSKKYL